MEHDKQTHFAGLALLLALGILPAVGRAQSAKAALYASLGAELTQYDVDADAANLVKQATVTVPANIQYAWPHPSHRYLYVVWSNGGASNASPGASVVPRGNLHGLSAFGIDPRSGALHPIGQAAMLPSRPIHVSTDMTGSHVLVAYNDPSGVTVHRINADGTIGSQVQQPEHLDTGIYAHQIRVDPSNRMVILVTRGNGPTKDKPEDRGAIKIFDYADGVLKNRTSIPPQGGLNFQPRHLDFHPAQPWVFVSLERQSKLQVYSRLKEGGLRSTPLFTKNSLADPAHAVARQNAGTVHVHPNGRYIYQANRAVVPDSDGMPSLAGGENSVAVYAVNPTSGEPSLIQNIDTRGGEPRTFALDPSGRMLVAANQVQVRNRANGSVLPASLAVFKVRSDGKLEFVRKYDVPASAGKSLFWMGLVQLP